MRLFTKYCLTFTLIWIAYMGVMFTINTWLIHTKQPVYPKTRILVVGDSHIMAAINPDSIKDCQNIAQTAESYFVSYFKIKKFCEVNPAVKTILLTYSCHNFSAFNDYKFSDPYWSKAQFERIYDLIPFQAICTFEADKKKFANIYMQKMLLYPNVRTTEYIGNFRKNNHSLLIKRNDPEDIIHRHFYYKDSLLGISEKNEQYLDSILKFGVQKNIQIILVSTPLNKEYLKRIPQNHVAHFVSLKEEHEKTNLVLDYSHLQLHDSLFIDYNHLNFKGSAYFTKIIANDLYRKHLF